MDCSLSGNAAKQTFFCLHPPGVLAAMEATEQLRFQWCAAFHLAVLVCMQRGRAAVVPTVACGGSGSSRGLVVYVFFNVTPLAEQAVFP